MAGPNVGARRGRPGTSRAGLALTLVLIGPAACMTDRADRPRVEIVRDLAKVAGCRFVGTVEPPRVAVGLRSADGFQDYLDALRWRTAALGGTHLYLLNEAAGWGAARAVGTAYSCIVVAPS